MKANNVLMRYGNFADRDYHVGRAPNCPIASQREVAAIMGLSYQAVQQIEKKALKKLRLRLGPYWRAWRHGEEQ